MRRAFAWAALLALVAILSGCARHPRQPPMLAAWWQWGAFHLSDHRSRAWRSEGFTDIFVCVGELRPSVGKPLLLPRPYSWGKAASGLPITLVVTLGGGGLEQALERDWALVARGVVEAFRGTNTLARESGVRAKGYHIDVRSDVRGVGRYADIVEFVSKQMRTDAPVSATITPAMLYAPAARDLASAAEFLVLRTTLDTRGMSLTQAASSAPTPALLGKWVGRAADLRVPFAVLLDAQPRFVVEGRDGRVVEEQKELTDSQQAYSVVESAGFSPESKPSRTIDSVICRLPANSHPRRMLVLAPHSPGIARLLKEAPPGRRRCLGALVTVANDPPGELAISDGEVGAASRQEPCLPAPSITLLPEQSPGRPLVIRVENTGCGRPSLARDAVRLRVECPRGAAERVEPGGFREIERSGGTGASPTEILQFSGDRLTGGGIQTGPIRLRPRPEDRLQITAILDSPMGLPAGSSTVRVNSR